MEKFNLNISDIEKQLKFPEALALDVWQVCIITSLHSLVYHSFSSTIVTFLQNDTQRGSISLCCSELEAMLENGIQCGVITELSGPPFSGKTQIW